MDWALLRAVSRSFYLTIRVLPRAVREPIALGYLLARASDTIADTSGAEIGMRLDALCALRDETADAKALPLLAGRQSRPEEATLLRRLPGLLHEVEASAARERLRTVWGHILRGQIFDLTRFPAGAAPLSVAELDEYAYLVAGSVGEFWTRLCADRLTGFSRRPIEELVELGVGYGKGLQLVNILRDRAADAAMGRGYVPEARFPEVKRQAVAGMDAGLKWVAAVDNGRIRFACAVPARIGMETLARIEADSGAVKISRTDVRRVLAGALPQLWRK